MIGEFNNALNSNDTKRKNQPNFRNTNAVSTQAVSRPNSPRQIAMQKHGPINSVWWEACSPFL